MATRLTSVLGASVLLLASAAGAAGARAAAVTAGELRLAPFDPAETPSALAPSVGTMSDTLAAWLPTLLGDLGIAGLAGLAGIGARRRSAGRADMASDELRVAACVVDVVARTGDACLHLRDGRLVLAAGGPLGIEPRRGAALEGIVHPEDLAPLVDAVASLVAPAPRRDVSCRLIATDGRSVPVACVLCRLNGDAGVLVIARDVTAERAEADELRQALDAARAAQGAADAANRAKGDFLASMSHEIRTPLNAVIGFADLLIAAPDLSATARRSAERIKAGGDALLTVVNDVLDYAQLEAGSLRLAARPFVLPLLVDECVALVERFALAKNLALRVELADRFAAGVLGDEARLRQILLNLLNNAIKFTDNGAVTIRIGCDGAPERLLFEVSDTGAGIAHDDLPGLFERFRQLDGAVRRSQGGTGLGLAISKALVERMGGTIGVRSVRGVGSTFWFTLDLPAAPLVLEAERAAPPADAARALRILLVEDIRINQELARAILEARGHEVDAVGDGADAIMAVEHEDFDLVLMDVQMPYVDGLTATRAIRQLPVPSRFVPIVAMTANVLREQVAAARASGMDDVLAKPLSLDTLDALLARAARNALVESAAESTPDAGLETRLAAEHGAAERDALLAGFAAAASARLVQPLGPATAVALRAEARALAGTAAPLGFDRLAAACDAFAGDTSPTEAAHAALLRDLRQAVAFASKGRGQPAARRAPLAA